MNPAHLYLVTGERGAGKTRFCRAVAELAWRSGWQVGGLLSPAEFESREKTGITLQNLPEGGSYPLATRCNQPPFTLKMGEWIFDPQVLEWGNTMLEALANATMETKSLNLLVIDEIGPLELLRGEGWTAALPLLNRGKYHTGLVVIRPELVDRARALLPAFQGTISLDGSMNLEEEAGKWWEVHSYE